MYEDSYGLSRPPFASVPQTDHYFPGATIEAARQNLARCIERAEGVGLVIGPSGTGKTLLSMMLAEQFRDSFQVALLSSGRLGTRRALLQAILFELGQPYRGMDEGELRLALLDHLTVGDSCPKGMLLIADEAHTLTLRLLDEIRMITNLVTDGQPRTRLVMAGGAMLEERFASPKLESFGQRIAARCYLEAMNRDETLAYIHAQIGMAGRNGAEVIPEDACHAVYQATDGVPRLVNQVCDHALLLACAAGREQVDRAVIEEAWADLQQLPTPWNGDSSDARSEGGVIEFGGLDDEPPAPPQAEAPASDAPPATDEAAGAESAPVLRISPESGEAHPVRQVERIQEAVASMEEDFRPAGSIGPEVELVFDGPHDPFSEKFEQEEAIVDRFAVEEEEEPGTSAQLGSQAPPEQIRADAAEPVGRPLAADEDAGEPSEAPESPEAWDGEPETVSMVRGSRPDETNEDDQDAQPDDEDLIVVEEGYDELELVGARPAAPVRRQEYRQLFARLRRGG